MRGQPGGSGAGVWAWLSSASHTSLGSSWPTSARQRSLGRKRVPGLPCDVRGKEESSLLVFSFSLGSKESVFCSYFSLFGEWPLGLCTILDNKWCCDPSLHPEPSSVSCSFFFFLIFASLLIWLPQVLVVTCRIFHLHCSRQTFSCSVWDLVP